MRGHKGGHRHLLDSLFQRETTSTMSPSEFISLNQVTPSSIARLSNVTQLNGHEGCVNCLQWNAGGDILASGSDDLSVILWDPFNGTQKTAFRTEHTENIFSVKFLPFSGDKILATGAGDNHVTVFDLEASLTTRNYGFQSRRVKRLEVLPDSSSIVLSASEDGTVMLFDIRCPPQSAQVLVDLRRSLGAKAEAKCLAVNPVFPETLAVGANDFFVRVYDRRMIKPVALELPTSFDDNIPNPAVTSGCVHYYAPGHASLLEQSKFLGCLCSTYVTFSPDGKELLANLGWDHVYLFDTKVPDVKPVFSSCSERQNCDTMKCSSGEKGSSSISTLTGDIEQLKTLANSEFQSENYGKAIAIYNVALTRIQHPVLLGNRAAAYMKRKWNGDCYVALRDCYRALALDPYYVKAHYRLTKCLIELKQLDQAEESLESFRRNHPDQTDSLQFKNLVKSLQNAGASDKNGADDSSDEDDLRSPEVNKKDEKSLREGAFDFMQRFYGHGNTSTDIKEATFYGQAGRYILAGSDDGRFFCWDKESSNLMKMMTAGDSAINCVQGHPSTSFLATSGIGYDVKIWAPSSQEECPDDSSADDDDFEVIANANQLRLSNDPSAFEILYEDRLRVMCNQS